MRETTSPQGSPRYVVPAQTEINWERFWVVRCTADDGLCEQWIWCRVPNTHIDNKELVRLFKSKATQLFCDEYSFFQNRDKVEVHEVAVKNQPPEDALEVLLFPNTPETVGIRTMSPPFKSMIRKALRKSKSLPPEGEDPFSVNIGQGSLDPYDSVSSDNSPRPSPARLNLRRTRSAPITSPSRSPRPVVLDTRFGEIQGTSSKSARRRAQKRRQFAQNMDNQCRQFRIYGQCSRGAKCKWLHILATPDACPDDGEFSHEPLPLPTSPSGSTTPSIDFPTTPPPKLSQRREAPRYGSRRVFCRVCKMSNNSSEPQCQRCGKDLPETWECPRCDAAVYAYKRTCYKCHAPRPKDSASSGQHRQRWDRTMSEGNTKFNMSREQLNGRRGHKTHRRGPRSQNSPETYTPPSMRSRGGGGLPVGNRRRNGNDQRHQDSGRRIAYRPRRSRVCPRFRRPRDYSPKAYTAPLPSTPDSPMSSARRKSRAMNALIEILSRTDELRTSTPEHRTSPRGSSNRRRSQIERSPNRDQLCDAVRSAIGTGNCTVLIWDRLVTAYKEIRNLAIPREIEQLFMHQSSFSPDRYTFLKGDLMPLLCRACAPRFAVPDLEVMLKRNPTVDLECKPTWQRSPKAGWTALHEAAYWYGKAHVNMRQARVDDCLSKVRVLLQYGFNPFRLSQSQQTALDIVATNGNKEAFEEVVECIREHIAATCEFGKALCTILSAKANITEQSISWIIMSYMQKLPNDYTKELEPLVKRIRKRNFWSYSFTSDGDPMNTSGPLIQIVRGGIG